MKPKTSRQEQQARAKRLYISGKETRKSIAQIIGCTEKTLRNWIDKFEWDALRNIETITRKQLLAEAYKQLRAVNTEIAKNGGIPNKELSDAKSILRKEIELLSDNPIHIYTETYDALLEFTKANEPSIYKPLAEVMEQHIQRLLKENQ
ncbi:phage terminase small subunit [Elysia marginata]|uniref:Phage terminase small subunit n=1 Tax=Elysia marginata TaxID=1093978 RepID=A0AAV4GYY2_9GAST|nr:phage terminase small subunit [Elysia marginata]